MFRLEDADFEPLTASSPIGISEELFCSPRSLSLSSPSHGDSVQLGSSPCFNTDPVWPAVAPEIPVLDEVQLSLIWKAAKDLTEVRASQAEKMLNRRFEECMFRFPEPTAVPTLKRYDSGSAGTAYSPTSYESTNSMELSRSPPQSTGRNHSVSCAAPVGYGSANKRAHKIAARTASYCEFCYNNARYRSEEKDGIKFNPDSVGPWNEHRCKDVHGKVECPVLSNLVCPECGATGADAHTIRYCPEKKRKQLLELERKQLVRTRSSNANC